MNRAYVVGLVFALAAGCGDNLKRQFVIETRVGKHDLQAGERVNARCAVLDEDHQPALDENGDPLTDTTEFVIGFQHEDSFGTDDEDQVIATKVGTATVRCGAPELGLVDKSPEQLVISPGPAVRVVTKLASASAMAGDAVDVSCLAFDAFQNEVPDFAHTLALSPSGAGTTVTDDAVTATAVGEYQVSCVVMGAADVEHDVLVVVPALPSSLLVTVEPERTVYAVDDQVTVVAEARDRFGNRVDDAGFMYGANPNVPSPSEARFKFAADGTFELAATVTTPTYQGALLSGAKTVFVNSAGPSIECRRADAPGQTSEAYMLQRGPSSMVVPVHVTDAFQVQSVTINGQPATLDAGTGNYQAALPVGFGMAFFDVVARDQFGKENSTTCFTLIAEQYTAEANHMGGSLGMRLDPNAIGDPNQSGLNSINDILHVILSSAQLRALVNEGLLAANPISNGSCGVFACTPRVNYNGGTVNWDPPSNTLQLVPGGLQAQVTLPNVRLTVNACGTTCCIGGSTIQVSASSIGATVAFSLQLQGGVLRAAVSGSPNVTVGSVSLNGSGFCGIIIDLLEGFFENTVRNAVRDALANFISSNVGPLLDQLVSSLDVNTLGTSFNVPRLDNTGSIQLGFGLAFSTFEITTARGLLGIGTRFTPGTAAHNRPSLGIARRTPNPLLDPPGTTSTRTVGISLYEGVLNQVLHGLWRGGFFQASLGVGNATATIDGRLPPVAMITSTNHAQLMLGGISATIRIPGVIDTPIPILFGGRADASISLVGEDLTFGGLTITQLFVSFQVSLTQTQRTAMANFLTQLLQSVLADSINKGLPAFPIPTFTLPDSVAEFGLPPGAVLGLTSPAMTTTGSHVVLTGGFGVRN